MNTAITARAVTHMDGINPWQFAPTLQLFIDGQDLGAHPGKLVWHEPRIQTGPAIQARDWCFFMGKVPLPPLSSGIELPGMWMIMGLHGDSAYIFDGLGTESVAQLRAQFVTKVIRQFFPILYPELRRDDHNVEIPEVLPPGGLDALLQYHLGGGVAEQTPAGEENTQGVSFVI